MRTAEETVSDGTEYDPMEGHVTVLQSLNDFRPCRVVIFILILDIFKVILRENCHFIDIKLVKLRNKGRPVSNCL